MENLILKVLVGSRAHGLHNEDSDYDYRGVFVLPTEEILCLKNVGGKYRNNDWFEGKEDQTTYEIGHFLKLATKCNPSILECFKAPMKFIDTKYDKERKTIDSFGHEIRELFPYVWNPNDAFSAFTGYSNNQRTKMLNKKDNRERKYACAYLRTLYNLECLLSTGDFQMDVTHNPYLFKRLKDIREGKFYTFGDVINECEEKVLYCKKLRDMCDHKPDLEKVNKFLLKVRKEFWNES